MVARLQPLSPCLVVLEASGGYEGVVAAALAEAGLPVAIVNPRQVRQFAGAIGRLAKTDAIDAAVIAHFAQAVRPAIPPLPDELAVRLGELMARRRQLGVMINAEKQRLAKAHHRVAQSSFRAVIRRLDAERARIDKAIEWRSDPLRENSGVGKGGGFVGRSKTAAIRAQASTTSACSSLPWVSGLIISANRRLIRPPMVPIAIGSANPRCQLSAK